MNRTAFKFAASTLIVSMTMVGFSTQSTAMRRLGNSVQANSPTDRQAAQLHEEAARALQQGQLAAALTQMEQAVALSSRDVGYRLLLADIYLKSGRFESARATYADVLALDPSNVRGGLSFALTQIALGRPQAAVQPLEDLAGRAPAADVGLALALAGRVERAIELLDHAARSPSATPRTRQNLALAYAMSGDWRRARAIAAQDLSPAEVAPRMQQWAAFSRPGAAPTHVAALLGVSPSEDSGQPVALALAPAAPPAAAYAEAPAPAASPASFEPQAPAGDAPIQVAEVSPAEAPAVWVPTAQSYQPAPEAPLAEIAEAIEDAPEAPAAPAREEQGRYAVAARTLVTPQAPLIRASATSPRVPAPVFQREQPVTRGSAPVVVQLGAFSNEGNAERAWLAVARRHGLASYRPLTTTYDQNGRTLHRVSVSGFASRADAQRLCGSIRGQGGACFVRAQAGDASIRWAARYADPRRRNV